MTILIQQSGTKRVLTGAFELKGSRNDLVRIARQMLEQADRDNFSDGWIEIHPMIEGGTNKVPINWHHEGPSPDATKDQAY